MQFSSFIMTAYEQKTISRFFRPVRIDRVKIASNERTHIRRNLAALDGSFGVAAILRISGGIGDAGRASACLRFQIQVLAACSALNFAGQFSFSSGPASRDPSIIALGQAAAHTPKFFP